MEGCHGDGMGVQGGNEMEWEDVYDQWGGGIEWQGICSVITLYLMLSCA
jgi:hypothetical protein